MLRLYKSNFIDLKFSLCIPPLLKDTLSCPEQLWMQSSFSEKSNLSSLEDVGSDIKANNFPQYLYKLLEINNSVDVLH